MLDVVLVLPRPPPLVGQMDQPDAAFVLPRPPPLKGQMDQPDATLVLPRPPLLKGQMDQPPLLHSLTLRGVGTSCVARAEGCTAASLTGRHLPPPPGPQPLGAPRSSQGHSPQMQSIGSTGVD